MAGGKREGCRKDDGGKRDGGVREGGGKVEGRMEEGRMEEGERREGGEVSRMPRIVTIFGDSSFLSKFNDLLNKRILKRPEGPPQGVQHYNLLLLPIHFVDVTPK